MRLQIAVLPGAGIGPEVTEQAVRVLRTLSDISGYDFQFSEHPVGGTAIRQFGSPLPGQTLDACLASNAVLLGAVGGPEFDFGPTHARPEAGLLQLRVALGGFANLRPARWRKSVADCSPFRKEIVADADVLIVRELLGGLYFGEPRGSSDTEAYNTMRYTEEQVKRVAHIAFAQARKRRKKVTSIDKANVLETSQLWRRDDTSVVTVYYYARLLYNHVEAPCIQWS